MPRRKVVRARKTPDSRLVDLIMKGTRIREMTPAKRALLAAQNKQDYLESTARIAEKLSLTPAAVRDGIHRRIDLVELAAQVNELPTDVVRAGRLRKLTVDEIRK